MKPMALASLNYFKCLQSYFSTMMDRKDFTDIGRRLFLMYKPDMGLGKLDDLLATCLTTDLMKHVRENMIDIEVPGAATLDEEFWQRVTSRFIEGEFLQHMIKACSGNHLHKKGATIKGAGMNTMEDLCTSLLCSQYSEMYPHKFSANSLELYKEILQLYRQSIVDSIVKCIASDVLEKHFG